MEAFYQQRDSNFYDKLNINVKKIYRNFPINKISILKSEKIESMKKKYYKIYRNGLIPLKIRNFIWNYLRKTSIDLTWLYEFNNYWTKTIGGRNYFVACKPVYQQSSMQFLNFLLLLRSAV